MSIPFEFSTAAELVEITGQQARNLDQLHAVLRAAEPAAISTIRTRADTVRELRSLADPLRGLSNTSSPAISFDGHSSFTPSSAPASG